MINIALSIMVFVAIKWTFLKIVTAWDDAGSSGFIASVSRSWSVVRRNNNSGKISARDGISAFRQRSDAEPYRDFDQIGKRGGLHLLHYSAPVRLHGDFADPKLSADFLIRKSGNHQG